MENTILFVGATGVGKSFLCNKIFEMCGSPVRFKSGSSLTAVTGALQQGHIIFQGKQFCVVDSPGFFDTKADSTPESSSKTDGENMCKLFRALEDCKGISCLVFVFDLRFSTPHKLWYDRIRDLVGSGYRGQLIMMNNKLDVMTERDLIENEILMQSMVGLAEGRVPYFPIFMAPQGSSEANMTQVKDQLNRFLSTVSKFVPFNLKDLQIPEICYEKEVVEGPFDRELANDKVDKGVQVKNIYDRSGYVDEMVPAGDPLMRLFGGKEKIRVYESHKEEEMVHVPNEVTTRVVGKFYRYYKVRFDGTRDFVREECVEEKEHKY